MFGYSCDNIYWLGHNTTGRKTQIWSLLSAESSRYTKNCFNATSTTRWDDFLGDYLEGVGPVFGGNPHTLRDAESEWLNDIQAATTTSCSNCSCNFTNGNNNITGFMWFVSSILFENNFRRLGRSDLDDSKVKCTFLNNELTVFGTNLNDRIKIIDIQGRVIIEKQIINSPVNLNYLNAGIYLGCVTDQNGQMKIMEKIVIVE